MTEAEWHVADFAAMLIHLRGELTPEEQAQHNGLYSGAGRLAPGPARRTSPGRLRAFAAACMPRWRELPFDPASLNVIAVYEAFLRGAITRDQYSAAALALQAHPRATHHPRLSSFCVWWDDAPHGVGHMTGDLKTYYANHVARAEIAEWVRTAPPDDLEMVGWCGYDSVPLWLDTVKALQREFGALLRETVGNPFAPVAFDPSWRTEAVVGLARGMYESRDFGFMPVLADALEDAGCAAADVLAHCRGAGLHVRGCWVVDLVLGKA